MTSRYLRRRAMGDATFSATPTPVCPPGMHWEPDAAPTIRGIAACVPNKVVTLRLVPHAAASAPAPAPAMPIVAAPTVTTSPAMTTDAAAAPSAPAAAPASVVCPEPWPLWWLAVAAAVGIGGGVLVGKEEKKKRRRTNGGRIAYGV